MPGRGNQHPGGNNPQTPSPWLLETIVQPDPQASFVEYLRWMREPGQDYKDPTKVQLLQLAEEGANYFDRLKTLTDRTRKIAETQGVVFQAKCTWRIRVGGHRGPESILLPAFDALGIPYIPSSTLRGVARTQAIRSLMQSQNFSWEQAEEHISRHYFGYLDSKNSEERSGKIVFLDAYPLPQPSGKSGGLAVDMANNIWKWDGDRLPTYSPNPNPFFSLQEPTLLIGLRPGPGCDSERLKQVKEWLSQGLQLGVGSQVNTGYGSLLIAGEKSPLKPFFAVEFSLEGQLIHGQQKFTQWNWNPNRQEWQMRGKPHPEVRSIAFKSMLRYWFRSFALGVLPSGEVKTLESQLFGAIDPQTRGWVIFQIHNGKLVQKEARPTAQGKDDPCGEQSGELKLFLSSEAPTQYTQAIASLMQSLVWLMFHLGGIGQGARRPCYSRKTRDRAPWWRGSSLFPEESEFWNLPDEVAEFKTLFDRRLQVFYSSLGKLTTQTIQNRSSYTAGPASKKDWVEAVDANCRIVVCSGATRYGKPYALSVLHSDGLKYNGNYDGSLCGTVFGKVKPSPVWIADLGDYQVVTVFGVTDDPQNPRCRFLKELKAQTDRDKYAQI
nr:RAMP superfamily CRISPR-associated protein [Prochlorothrix hollandica]